jgi:hypothetical protein
MKSGLPPRAAVLLAALLAGLCAASCGMRSPLPEGAELIPADATFAVSVDVPAILESALYKNLRTNEGYFGTNRANFYRFAEATGLDPAKDIQRVLFMARAAQGEGIAQMTGVVIGSFDGRKVHDYLTESGLPVRQVEGMDIFEMVVVSDRCVFCLAVIDSSTAAFGAGETLETIARIRGGSMKGIAEEERAGRLLRRVGRHPEAWGILRAENLTSSLLGMFERVTGDTTTLGELGPIQEASFSFDTAEPLRILVELAASSEDDALLVADVLKGAESVGRVALREARPEMAGLMSDIVIEADTGIVRLAGSIPSSEIRYITELFGDGLVATGIDAPRAQPEEQAP